MGGSQVPSLGWSDFARARYRAGRGHSYFEGSESELLDLVRAGWAQRRPGAGRKDLSQVVVVPVPCEGFVGSTVLVDETTALQAGFERRQPAEDGYVKVSAAGPAEPVRFAGVVLYSGETLLENGGSRSCDADWEVVSLLAEPAADTPLHPLTMARNYLEKPGGTHCEYSAREFAEAIYYWSCRAALQPEEERA